jgi:hypothetical protein
MKEYMNLSNLKHIGDTGSMESSALKSSRNRADDSLASTS